MKIDAVEFSWAGDKYIGRSYDDMDCQKFVEKCMADCGLPMDLGGSNSWYREMTWTGTPEECVKIYGSIPKGALLFILEPVSGSTPAKFRNDGIGDATHMGIKTGRGDGAIHSSHTRGGVATSVFKDKTIKNGGWNRVGLYDRFTYGKTVDWVLAHIGIGEQPEKPNEEVKPMTAVISSEDGNPVKLRQSKDQSSAAYGIYDKYDVGTQVEIIQNGEKWSKVRIGKKTGWMMSKFLIADEGGIPSEPDMDPGDGDGLPQTGNENVTLTLTADEAYFLLPVLQKAAEQIEKQIGRG